MRTLLGRGIAPRLTLVAVAALAIAACGGSTAATAGPAHGGDAFGPATGADLGASGVEGPVAAPSVAAPVPAGGDTSGGVPADANLQVVYTGSLQLVVADVAPAVAKAKVAVESAGGYVGASQETNDGDKPAAVITYRIPAPKWDDTITALRGLATKVVSEQTQASEVGSQVVDLQARIANLRASETALQGIAQNSAKVSDLLEVQAQLTDVRGQIEVLDANLKRLSDQVAYGTLVTTFGVEVAQVTTAAQGWDPGADVDGATAALLAVSERLASAVIWFAIAWVPFIAVALVLLLLAWRVVLRAGPRLPATPAAQGPIAGWGDDAPDRQDTPPEP